MATRSGPTCTPVEVLDLERASQQASPGPETCAAHTGQDPAFDVTKHDSETASLFTSRGDADKTHCSKAPRKRGLQRRPLQQTCLKNRSLVLFYLLIWIGCSSDMCSVPAPGQHVRYKDFGHVQCYSSSCGPTPTELSALDG